MNTLRSSLALALAPVLLAASALTGIGCGGATTSDPTVEMVGQRLSQAGPVEVGFTAPEAFEDPLATDMAEFIDGATLTLDVALYKVNAPVVVDAIVAAHEAGVAVRIVSDSKHIDRADSAATYQRFEAAGIPMVFDWRTADMHHKFLVRDGVDVWAGSYNPLDLIPTHAENALTISDAGVATAFTTEFEEMFVDRLFNKGKSDNTQHEFDVDGVEGTDIEVYFAPTDGVKNRMVRAINEARESIRFLVFSFSSDPIADAMLARYAEGLDVQGAIDRLQANKRGGDFARLLEAGLDVRRTPFLTMMHHKFLIIDAGTPDAIVLTGSFNFSAQADERNDEALVVIRSPETAHAYLAAYNQVFERCARLNADAAVGADLRITEVHANAVNERRGEFVEIVNNSDVEASVLGLYLFDGDAWDRVIPADGGPATLQPREVAVILDPDHDGVQPVAEGVRRFTVENGTLGDGLTNLDTVAIYGPDREIAIDTFSFPRNPGNGRSIVRTSADAPDVAESWVEGTIRFGTAGIYPEPNEDPWAEPTPEDELINVNTADAPALTKLPGIGPSTAGKIVADRDLNGVFCTIDDLTRVRRVGPKTVNNVRDLTTVGEPEGCDAPVVDDGPGEPAPLVNINTADKATLDTLPGIGPTTAQRIIDDRTVNGAFLTIEEITRVYRIGTSTFNKIAALITVG